MNSANSQDNRLQTILCSLTEDEISKANKVYELANRLEAALRESADINVAWLENVSNLDPFIQDTLSKTVKDEIKAIEKFEDELIKHRNPDDIHENI